MEPVDILLAAVKLVSMQALPRTCYGKGFFGGPTMVNSHCQVVLTTCICICSATNYIIRSTGHELTPHLRQPLSRLEGVGMIDNSHK